MYPPCLLVYGVEVHRDVKMGRQSGVGMVGDGGPAVDQQQQGLGVSQGHVGPAALRDGGRTRVDVAGQQH